MKFVNFQLNLNISPNTEFCPSSYLICWCVHNRLGSAKFLRKVYYKNPCPLTRTEVDRYRHNQWKGPFYARVTNKIISHLFSIRLLIGTYQYSLIFQTKNYLNSDSIEISWWELTWGKSQFWRTPPRHFFHFWETWLFTFAWQPKMPKWPTKLPIISLTKGFAA